MASKNNTKKNSLKNKLIYLKNIVRNKKNFLIIIISIISFVLLVSAGGLYFYYHPIKDSRLNFKYDKKEIDFTAYSSVISHAMVEVLNSNKEVVNKWEFNKNTPYPISIKKSIEDSEEKLSDGLYFLVFKLLGYKKEFPFIIDTQPPTAKLFFKEDGSVNIARSFTKNEKIYLDYEASDNNALSKCTLSIIPPKPNDEYIINIDNISDKKSVNGSVEVSLPFNGNYLLILECLDKNGNENEDFILEVKKGDKEPVIEFDLSKTKDAKWKEFNNKKYPIIFKYPSTWKVSAIYRRDIHWGFSEKEIEETYPFVPNINIPGYYNIILTTDFNTFFVTDIDVFSSEKPYEEYCTTFTANTDEFYILKEIEGTKIGRSKSGLLYIKFREDVNSEAYLVTDENNPGCYLKATAYTNPRHKLIGAINTVSIKNNAISPTVRIYIKDKKVQMEMYPFSLHFYNNQWLDSSNLPQNFEDILKIYDEVIKSIKINPNWKLPLGYSHYRDLY